MSSLLADHKEMLLWLGGSSVLMFVGSLLLIPLVVLRMQPDYFLPERDRTESMARKHPVWRALGLALKNVCGAILLLAGFAMLFLPGQGMLTMLLGIGLLDFPGKRKLELRLIRLPGVLGAINALRARRGREPLTLPPAV